MAHEIDRMAYAGETPWHGLGTYVGESNVTSARMLDASGLNWTVRKDALATETGIAIPDLCAIVREDRNHVLGYCGPDYPLFQNAEAFAFMDELLGQGGARYHTAGSLLDGRRVWVLVELGGAITVRRQNGEEDPLQKFLLLSTGHTGKTALVIQSTAIRVVCWNTLSVALRDTRNQWRIWHKSALQSRVEEARQALRLSVAYFDELARAAQELEDARMSRDEFREFADRLILETEASIDEAKALLGRRAGDHHAATVHELGHLFEAGRGNLGATRWDGLNAVTEWVDHKIADSRRAVEEITRRSRALESAWFGEGARIKGRALRMLRG